MLLLAWLGTAPYIAATLAILCLGIVCAGRASLALGVKDPGVVVIDETVGLLVTMTLVPPSVESVLLAFFIFRALDVLKPLGIERLEHLPGGYGIMMDDFAAGVVGNVILQVALAIHAALGQTTTLVP